MSSQTSSKPDQPRLLHPSLQQFPQPSRFMLAGTISNILFVTGLNALSSPSALGEVYHASTIYSVFYLLFMPVSHAMTCLLVFGWPDPYLPSLLSTAPIGLTAMGIGAWVTGYLESVGFDALADDFITENMSFLDVASAKGVEDREPMAYSSFLVLALTGLWTYALTTLVMSSGKKKSSSKVEKVD